MSGTITSDVLVFDFFFFRLLVAASVEGSWPSQFIHKCMLRTPKVKSLLTVFFSAYPAATLRVSSAAKYKLWKRWLKLCCSISSLSCEIWLTWLCANHNYAFNSWQVTTENSLFTQLCNVNWWTLPAMPLFVQNTIAAKSHTVPGICCRKRLALKWQEGEEPVCAT